MFEEFLEKRLNSKPIQNMKCFLTRRMLPLISKINWITHRFELNELILKPEYIYNELRFSNLSNSLQIKLLGIEISFTIKQLSWPM